MSKLHITGNKVHILSGGKIEMTSPTFATDFVFPTTATEIGENLQSNHVVDEDNLSDPNGGEATLTAASAGDVVGVELGGFNFTGSNDVPSNANITKVEFAYNSRMLLTAQATNPVVVGDPAADLTYQLTIGFHSDGVDYAIVPFTNGFDDGQYEKDFKVHAPISNNETYPSEPTIENFSHLATSLRPAFLDKIEPDHIRGTNQFSIKLGRLGGRFLYNSNLNPTIAGLVEDSINFSTDGTGQSIFPAYRIGLNRNSNGPALKVHYNFSPS